MKRRFDPSELELMDRPQPVSAELESDLANLRQLNRFFGSYALVSRFLRRWIKQGDRLRMVDLATGSGDIPRLVVDYARRVGAQVSVEAIDGQAATLEIARRLSENYPEIRFHLGDIRTWEAGEAYDIVLCSLVLHHFSEQDAVTVLQHARELSQGRVLVADLRRGLLASAGVFLLTATVFRDPMTKFDGRMSAARAFSFSELRELAKRAGWKDFGHAKFKFARQAIWSEETVVP
jgi:2-polyprenyl-3-methyl-5-hydroxy-6-metoxy-1,4-benzoquinol methylase